MSIFYVNELDGGKPVIFKPHYRHDQVEYEAHCPTCDKQFTIAELFTENYCHNCGTKLWKHYQYPDVIKEDEDN